MTEVVVSIPVDVVLEPVGREFDELSRREILILFRPVPTVAEDDVVRLLQHAH